MSLNGSQVSSASIIWLEIETENHLRSSPSFEKTISLGFGSVMQIGPQALSCMNNRGCCGQLHIQLTKSVLTVDGLNFIGRSRQCMDHNMQGNGQLTLTLTLFRVRILTFVSIIQAAYEACGWKVTTSLHVSSPWGGFPFDALVWRAEERE